MSPDATFLSLFALDARALTRFLRSILHSPMTNNTGRDRIVGRGRRKHATRGDPNEWGDDLSLWESHPNRSHGPAREKTPRKRRLEKEAERTTKNLRGRKLQEAPKERAIPSQTGQFGHGRTIFVLHVLGERTREECGQAMFHLR